MSYLKEISMITRDCNQLAISRRPAFQALSWKTSSLAVEHRRDQVFTPDIPHSRCFHLQVSGYVVPNPGLKGLVEKCDPWPVLIYDRHISSFRSSSSLSTALCSCLKLCLSSITRYSSNHLHKSSQQTSIMPAGGIALSAPISVDRIEAPVTARAYLMCAFAAFAGIFFGFDTGYISGTIAMKYFIHQFTGLPYPAADATTEELAAFALPA
jgi:hypothetical protein